MSCFQIHLLDAKRQLETETNLHMNTKELLKNAQKENVTLKQQLRNMEAQLASQSSQRAPGQGKRAKMNTCKFEPGLPQLDPSTCNLSSSVSLKNVTSISWKEVHRISDNTKVIKIYV